MSDAPGIQWQRPDWPAPANVQAGSTCRTGGVSRPPYDSLNLALHVGDDPAHVAHNRQRLALPAEPLWLEQVHSLKAVDAGRDYASPPKADAAYSRQAGRICAVMTADCLPLLICDRQGQEVAAIHAGWRGLLGGIIENTLACLVAPAEELLVWLGPAIGPQAYEVGEEVRQAFVQHSPQAAEAFVAGRAGHWWMDIYALARQRLVAKHVTSIHGGTLCTFSDPEHYYSYRRDGVTGRMASVIWFE